MCKPQDLKSHFIMSRNATIAVILYTSKTLSNGEHPIMLRITKDRKRKYISLGLSSPLNLWDEKRQLPKHNHPERLKIEAIIDKKKKEYRDIILNLNNEGKNYTSQTLAHSIEQPKKIVTVWTYFDEQIAAMKSANQERNSNVYNDTKRNLVKFYGKKDLLFSDIDTRWLNKYETWLRSQGLKDTSISFYFRTFRALFNKAIAEKVIKKDVYPFDDYKLSKFKMQTQKRAITKDDMKRIIDLELPPNSRIWFSQQVFAFIYFAQGINIKDLSLLKWKNIVNGRIYYSRSKTKQLINFGISGNIQNILDEYHTQTGGDAENYIFPILDKNIHISLTQIANRVHKVMAQINQDLKEIGQLAHIDIPLSTYVARHTYATVLKKGGANISKISQALGHTNLKTTEIYLKSFDDEEIDKMNDELLL